MKITKQQVILTIIGVVIASLLVLVSLPHQNNYASQNVTFIYNDKDLKLAQNDNNLTTDQKQEIDNTKADQQKLSVNIEDNKSFSTLGGEKDVNGVLGDAVKLVDGVEVNIDNHTYYLQDRQIFDHVMESMVQASFPNLDSYNTWKNSGKIEPVTSGSMVFSGFNVNNKITVKEGRVPEDKVIRSVDDFKFVLNNEDQEKQTVTIKTGQTINEILTAYDITPQEFNINNSIKTTDLISEGTEITVNKPDPVLDLETKYTYVSEESMPYRETTEQDSSMKVGESRIKQQGVDGRQNVTYEVTYVNGVETGTAPINYDIIEQPVPEIKLVGTYVVPGVGTGNLRWPATGCRITNGYGGADFAGVGHLAIDIQSGYGSPIFAADGGTVKYSGWDPYGGGNSILIDHGGGIQTQYNHMMSPSPLPTGAHVEQGQVIGYQGASGLATGPHLHFEVHVNGRRVNPLNYVSC